MRRENKQKQKKKNPKRLFFVPQTQREREREGKEVWVHIALPSNKIREIKVKKKIFYFNDGILI